MGFINEVMNLLIDQLPKVAAFKQPAVVPAYVGKGVAVMAHDWCQNVRIGAA